MDLADQTKKTGDLEKSLESTNREVITLNKDLADQTKKTEDKEKEFDTELKKEVEAREAEVGKIKTEVNSIDERLNKKEMRKAVCGYKNSLDFKSDTTLTFDRVYDEVDSSSGEGTLEKNGYFKAGVTGIYFITLETSVGLNEGEWLHGYLKLSSGNYTSNNEEYFIRSWNNAGSWIYDQASASRFVRMAAGETLHISLEPGNGPLEASFTAMCVSLYS